MAEQTEVFVGSGNVFADLGLPNPEELQIKAELAMQIRNVLRSKQLDGEQAAEQMGLDRAAFSRLLEGPSADFTFDQLFHCLNRLGRAIEVRLSADETEPDKAHTLLIAA